MALQSTPASLGKPTYRLRRYKRRTLLNIIGPPLMLGYFAFICLEYLNRPPVNNVAQANRVDARWVFYIWFLISIFALDWARVALANFESAAVMRSNLAPSTAMELMWHGDGNWANLLWWLRAIRNGLAHLMLDRDWGKQNGQGPGQVVFGSFSAPCPF
jgi:hypothetical protein